MPGGITIRAVKWHTVYRTFRTAKRRELVRITEDVVDAVREAGIVEGMVLVSAMHITAGVWGNDDEPGIHADALEWLDKLAPPTWREQDGEVGRALVPDPGDYRHHRGVEDNGDAHLKNLLVHGGDRSGSTSGRGSRSATASPTVGVRSPRRAPVRPTGAAGGIPRLRATEVPVLTSAQQAANRSEKAVAAPAIEHVPGSRGLGRAAQWRPSDDRSGRRSESARARVLARAGARRNTRSSDPVSRECWIVHRSETAG
jgi:thiamine phosphate synthase YjbQ (UPF0047 family)